ncbi:MAG: ABC transporter ATP-binding protein [Fibrobacteres bacterium]|nr:ABC transporter ATP-binding protein [Fibrobacterota bacterium]
MIKIENLTFSYTDLPFLTDVSLRVKEGELHAVIGANGAGKSTLLRLIGGLLEPVSGKILLNGRDGSTLSAIERARMVSYVFQENYTGFPYSVEQMVLLGRHPQQRSLFSDSKDDLDSTNDALKLLGMESYAKRLYRTLSGGEKQRVAIAAAIAQDTPIILFDEPTAFTDIKYQSEIYHLIHTICRERNLTTLVITHDVNLAALYSDAITVVGNGRLLATGTPEEVLTETVLSAAYSTTVKVIRHPDAGVPLIIPAVR